MDSYTYLLGAGQHTWRNDVDAPHPAAAMAHGSRLALADAGMAPSEVGLIASNGVASSLPIGDVDRPGKALEALLDEVSDLLSRSGAIAAGGSST